RRLPGGDEERDRYPGQVVAVARLVSRQALRAFRLMLTENGRVIDHPVENFRWQRPEPSQRFRLAIGGEEVNVAYTPGFFPHSDTDVLYYTSPHEPPRPHPLSTSGHHSHFASHDAVEAAGGPEAYAAL